MVGRVRAVFKFDRRLPNLDSIFRTIWQIMVKDDQRLLGAFPEPPMICFRRGQNVRLSYHWPGEGDRRMGLGGAREHSTGSGITLFLSRGRS